MNFLNFVTTDLTGNIEIRDNFGQPTGEIIGEFQFTAPLPVPEPTLLGLIGAIGAIALRPKSH